MLVKLGFRMIAIALFVMIVTMWRGQGGRGAGTRGKRKCTGDAEVLMKFEVSSCFE